MSAINHFNLRNFDLNLLIAFDALMRDRSVTRAAARMKVQQPAMSHSLATLRLLLDDELFVRVGHRMEPTAKAEMLAQQVSRILQDTQQLFAAGEVFVPAEAERTFSVGFFCEELVLLPELTAQLAREAPGVRLMTRRLLAANVATALDDGAVDLAVGCQPPAAARFHTAPLFGQQLACCYHPAQLDFAGGLGLAEWLGARHAFVSEYDAAEGCLGTFLIAAGHPLNVVLGTPDYLSLLAAVAEAPLLATLPLQIARHYAARFGLQWVMAPVQPALPEVQAIWSTRSAADNGLAWLRQQLAQVAQRAALLPRPTRDVY